METESLPLSESRSSPPLVFSVVEKKNDKNSSTSENILLSKVAPSSRPKAKSLLEAFNDNPQQLTWNDEGELFINNESVPNASIYYLLPAVYKTAITKNKSLPGFIEFVNQIGAMGLAHLISPKLLRGFKRKNKIQNQAELYNDVIKNDRWYYLGPI